MLNRGFHVPEPVPAQMCAPVPAGDNDNCVVNPFADHHLQNDHARTALAVIVFDFGSVRQPRRPRVMRSFCKLLGLFQAFEEILDVGVAGNPPCRDRVFRTAITYYPDVLNERIFYLHRYFLEFITQFRGFRSTRRPVQKLDGMNHRDFRSRADLHHTADIAGGNDLRVGGFQCRDLTGF